MSDYLSVEHLGIILKRLSETGQYTIRDYFEETQSETVGQCSVLSLYIILLTDYNTHQFLFADDLWKSSP